MENIEETGTETPHENKIVLSFVYKIYLLYLYAFKITSYCAQF